MSSHLLWAMLADVVLGAVLGGVGGLFGIGGGLIAIPILSYFYGMDQQMAQGTALVMITPNVLVGFWRYQQYNDIEWSSVVYLGIPAVVMTYFAARFAGALPAATLHFAFAVFIAFLACYFFWTLWRPRRVADASGAAGKTGIVLPKKYLGFVGVLGGATSGFFSVGGGIVSVPALVAFFGATQTAAQGMGLAAVTPGTVVALFTYAQAGHVQWLVGLPLAFGGILTVTAGVKLAHRLPERRLRMLFCCALVLMSLWMMAHG